MGRSLSCDGSSDRSLSMVQLSYFSFVLGLLNWYEKDNGVYYYVRGMIYIKDSLLLIGNNFIP